MTLDEFEVMVATAVARSPLCDVVVVQESAEQTLKLRVLLYFDALTISTSMSATIQRLMRLCRVVSESLPPTTHGVGITIHSRSRVSTSGWIVR